MFDFEGPDKKYQVWRCIDWCSHLIKIVLFYFMSIFTFNASFGKSENQIFSIEYKWISLASSRYFQAHNHLSFFRSKYWLPDEPNDFDKNEDCVTVQRHLFGKELQFNDYPCSWNAKGVCKWNQKAINSSKTYICPFPLCFQNNR